MSGLQHATRHPDRVNDPHARAHTLASDALLEQLDTADAAWLAEHLAGCGPCTDAAAAFAEDAELLRGLRADLPVAPRDLGARVSLALDAEVRRARRGRRGAGRLGRGASRPAFDGRPSLAFAGLAAVAVVALLVGPLAVTPGAPPASAPPGASLVPAATPITVDTQPVAWVRRSPDGTYVLSSAEVRRVCAGVDATACGTLDGGAQALTTLSVKPSSVLLPRDGSPAVVVGQDAVYAVAVNLVPPVTTPEPKPSPVPSSEPVPSPSASGELASPPVGSPAPSDPPTSPVPTAPDASPEPSAPASPVEATPVPTLPPATPAPSSTPPVAIAVGVVVVGAPPAYSADGQWVAFSARPVDGSSGPDIYAWRVGDQQAVMLTADHGSVFSGWVGNQIIGSTARVAAIAAVQASDAPTPEASPVPGASPDASPVPGASPVPAAVPAAEVDPTTVVARSFLIDPDGAVVSEIARDGIWRPVVDPTQRVVVFWAGSLAWSATDQAWLPAKGQLVLGDWQTLLGRAPAPDVTPDPNATPAPDVTPTPIAMPDRPLPVAAVGLDVADWEIRFDPAGRSLGIWVADPAEPGTGRLALVAVESDGSLGA
ncbi:MAG TPA: hypothetical protein VER83_03110, partial [Candidatus Nanopelagicales bacterium]|nr:hypothetical protein [Candidatus Nanopelagicales bacterium]